MILMMAMGDSGGNDDNDDDNVNDDGEVNDDDDLFIELMYGSAALTELVEQVLDLLRQVLVLPLHLCCHHLVSNSPLSVPPTIISAYQYI